VRAKSLGYANVFIMPDGIAGWVKAGKKVQPV
jgi:rhodanese-related sulfurtransferase